MPEAVLIFTFGPVQGFISEARRTSDLFVGSSILVRLAQATGKKLNEEGKLIYPAVLEDDIPNFLVARLPSERVEETAKRATQALLDEWKRIAQSARTRLSGFQPTPDQLWDESGIDKQAAFGRFTGLLLPQRAIKSPINKPAMLLTPQSALGRFSQPKKTG